MYCTFEDWSELPASERTRATELSQRQFHVEQWYTHKHQHDDERYEKRSSAVTIAQVREPPHVAQTHRIAADHTQRKIRLSMLQIIFFEWK